MTERPRVLVIAGYDQSAGAGVLSDVKTLEAHGVDGYAVCTAMTWQNSRRIDRIQWYADREIADQIDICFEDGGFDWVKIGIGRSIAMISAIVTHCLRLNPLIRIIWDPVIRASSGRDFWDGLDRREFELLAASCFLVTPNWDELGWLYPGEDVETVCRRLSAFTKVYLKGGHHPAHPGRDYCWVDGAVTVLEPLVTSVHPKHGSGCVLSSSLAANLALGYPLPIACARSKRYIESFLTSNETLSGWHRPIAEPD